MWSEFMRNFCVLELDESFGVPVLTTRTATEIGSASDAIAKIQPVENDFRNNAEARREPMG
jgi:hypothetical protein